LPRSTELSSEEKTIRAEKARLTREARHTLGPKAEGEIYGADVDVFFKKSEGGGPGPSP